MKRLTHQPLAKRLPQQEQQRLRVYTYLTPEESAALERAARERRVSQSKLIRDLIMMALQGHTSATADLSDL